MLLLLFALLTVIVAGRLLGALLRWFGQPAVIGEIIAGLALGPSLVGAQVTFSQALPGLGTLSQLGVVLYMFNVGLAFDARELDKRAVCVALASIALPFAFGVGIAFDAYSRFGGGGAVTLTLFALFLGVTLAVTAFPVLARILDDRKLTNSALGRMALASAAAGDVIAWCLLAGVIAVGRGQAAQAVTVPLYTLAFGALMWFGVRPLLRRLPLSPALVLCGMLASALATEWIGVHAVFGAFLFGVIVPDQPTLRQAIEQVAGTLLLPAYFAFTGMHTQLGFAFSQTLWGFTVVFIVLAIVGKYLGAALSARAVGLPWRDAHALGALMNTRGLMELIVLNLGLELGILPPALHGIGVLMALVTTLMTAPMLRLAGR